MALEVEDRGVGPPAALPRAPAHLPRGGVHFHVLLQVILALERLLAHFAPYGLWRGRQTLARPPGAGHAGKRPTGAASDGLEATKVLTITHQKASAVLTARKSVQVPQAPYGIRPLRALPGERGSPHGGRGRGGSRSRPVSLPVPQHLGHRLPNRPPELPALTAARLPARPRRPGPTAPHAQLPDGGGGTGASPASTSLLKTAEAKLTQRRARLPYLYGSPSRVLEAPSMFLPQRNILFDTHSLFREKQISALPFVNIRCGHQL